MKLTLSVACIIAYLAAIVVADPAAHDEQKDDGNERKQTICLLTIGRVDEKILDRVEHWLKRSLSPLPRVRRVMHCLSESLTSEQLTRKLQHDNLGPNDLCVLALIRGSGEPSIDDAIYVTNSVAVVYLAALRTKGIDVDGDFERYTRRVEKECIHAVGLALGLSPCVFPLCAMSHYENEAELDAKGLNLCPPCYGKMEKILLKKGLTFDEPVPLPPGTGTVKNNKE